MPNLLGVSYRRVDTKVRAIVDTRAGAISSVFVLLCWLLGAQPGLAQPLAGKDEPEQLASRVPLTKTILLVRSLGDEQVMAALRAEIDDRRFRIVEIRSSAERTKSLADLVSEKGAAAALRFNARLARVELSAALDSGNVEEVLHKDDASGDVEILALRTAETLRAHGLELGSYPAPANRSEPRSSSSARAAATRDASSPTTPDNRGLVLARPTPQTESFARKQLWVELAPGLLASSGGWNTIPIATVALRWALTRDLSLSALGLIPFVSQTLAAAEGSATIGNYLVGGTVSTTLLSGDVLSSTFGLGASVLVTQMHGRAQPGYRGAQEVVVTQAPHMSLGLSVALHPRWLLVSSLMGGVSIPRVGVVFADRLERTWGSPFAAISIGIAARAAPW